MDFVSDSGLGLNRVVDDHDVIISNSPSGLIPIFSVQLLVVWDFASIFDHSLRHVFWEFRHRLSDTGQMNQTPSLFRAALFLDFSMIFNPCRTHLYLVSKYELCFHQLKTQICVRVSSIYNGQYSELRLMTWVTF